MSLEQQKIYSEWSNTSSSEKLELRGLWGEYYLNLALNSSFGAVRYKDNPNGTYFLFDRIHIPSYNGKTTEIDSVLVCQKGIFAFEVKSWSGDAIYGERNSRNWFYVKSHFKGKISSAITGNPFRQNDFHVRYLSSVLPERVGSCIANIVLLTNATPFGVSDGNWAGNDIDGLFLNPDAIIRVINKMPNILSGKTVMECVECLSDFSYGEDF